MAASAAARAEKIKDTTAGQYQYVVSPHVGKTDLPFELHGYVKSGFGFNEKLGDQDSFSVPIAGGSYRLGNEPGTYGNLNLSKTLGGGKNPYAVVQAWIGLWSNSNLHWDRDNGLWAGANLMIGNLFSSAPDLKFWAGYRTYLLHNIHINQFVPFEVEGLGGGVDDIDLCFGKLNVAFFGDPRGSFKIAGSDVNYSSTDRGRLLRYTLDAHLHDVEVPLGTALFWFSVAYVPGGQLYENFKPVDPESDKKKELDSGFGVAGGFLHARYNFFGGTNKFMFQMGQGIRHRMRKNTDTVDDMPSDWSNKAWRLRVAEYFDIQPAESFSLMACLVYEYTHKPFDVHWASTGINPVWHFSKYFGLTADAGIDYVYHHDPGSKDWSFDGYMIKTALAPQIAPDRGYWTRPVVRIYGAYAYWSEGLRQSPEIRKRVGGDAHQNDSHGFGFGVQAEAWW
jgi:maltoporin